MKKPNFFEGVVVALVGGIFAGVVSATLGNILPQSLVMRFIVACIGFAYVVYLLRRSEQRIGRIVVVTLWVLFTLFTWLLPIPIALFIVLHIGALWLIRSLYFYASVVSSLTDLALTVFSALFALWAAMQTHSMFLTLWSFFLAQSLFVFIPTTLRKSSQAPSSTTTSNDRFDHAHQIGEAALKKLFTHH